MKAVAYLRVSTTEQANEGYSIQAQRRAAEGYCQAQGWELAEIYADEGRSGSSIEGRDELKRLLADAGSGQFERVIFWKLDRLGRSLRDLLSICDDLEAAGVGIVSIQESIDTGTAAGRMMRSVLGALGEFERDTIVSRIKAGIEEKARGGELVGPLPIGLMRDKTGAVVADETTAPLIREAFERYASGDYSLRDMGKWAADTGLTSATGRALDRLSIRKMLTNVAYRGAVEFHGRDGDGFTVNGKHPAIVDGELFGKVQKSLAGRRRSAPSARKPFGREPYPLSGILTCAYDGAPFVGQMAGKNSRRYLRCTTTARRGRDACAQPMVQAEIVEQQVAEYVGHMRLPPEALGAVVEELRRRQEKPGHDPSESRRAERQMERWKRLFVLGEIDEARYRAEVAPLRERAAEIDRPAETVDAERALQHLRDIGALWSEISRHQQRAFVREVFERMELRGAQLTTITPQPKYAPFFLLDRRERFGGEMAAVGGAVWLPGQDSNLQPIG